MRLCGSVRGETWKSPSSAGGFCCGHLTSTGDDMMGVLSHGITGSTWYGSKWQPEGTPQIRFLHLEYTNLEEFVDYIRERCRQALCKKGKSSLEL